MRRLIWVFAGRTSLIGFVLRLLNIYWIFRPLHPPYPPPPPPPPPHTHTHTFNNFRTDRSWAVPLLQSVFFVCASVVCFVIICSVSLLLLVPWADCTSWLWHFLGTFTCIFHNSFELSARHETSSLTLYFLWRNNKIYFWIIVCFKFT